MPDRPDKPPGGICCPLCQGPTKVVRTRSRDRARRVIRRRQCENRDCGTTFTTCELPTVRLAELTGVRPAPGQ